ncbi:MAG: VanZ family protein [Flavobacteriaceae bacterium]
MLKYKFTFLTFLFSFLIIFFSLIPIKIKIVESYSFFSLDKILHFLAYFLYTISIYLALFKEFSIKNSKLRSIVISFLVGFSLELVQGFFLTYRSFEILDLFSNFTGILTFAIVSKTIKKVIS